MRSAHDADGRAKRGVTSLAGGGGAASTGGGCRSSPSRILVLGPDSALAPLIAVAVVSRAAGDPARAVALASLLALLTGGVCVVGGLARAGLATDLLSKPVRVGYLNGIGLTVIVTQLPKLCGFSDGTPDLASGAVGFVRGVIAGRTQPAALAIGVACLAIILAGRAFVPRVPAVLVAIVAATTAVAALGLAQRIAVVGAVPRGVPLPALPAVRLDDVPDLFLASLGIALVSFADTSALSRTFAARQGLRVDTNRELIGLGVANLAAGFFQGFPVSSSATRTPVAESAGSRTQLTGVIGALALVTLLVAAPWLLEDLPAAALAAVVIAAALGIMDPKALAVFYRVRARTSCSRWWRSSPSPRWASCAASRSRWRSRSSTSCGAPGDRTTPCSGVRTA